jgi:hypothetical protein
MRLTLPLASLGFLLCACASISTPRPDLSGVTISDDFEAGNVESVTQDGQGFRIALSPEDTPINNSPWYAFEINGAAGKAVPITLAYTGGTHRYSPKIQLTDGSWLELESQVDVSEDKSTARFTITPSSDTVRIAAQAIMDTQDHLEWAQEMAVLDFVSFETIGSSVENRPIHKLEEIDNPNVDKPYIVLIGRQHPPEVTGAQSLQPFVETIWGDSKLAKSFREEFNVIVVPLMSPDGVARGYWRHNANGVDLNRDWGPFTQPETQAIEAELNRFKTGDDQMVLFLDFHSTWRNLIYTQTDEEPTTPAFFTRDWIANVKAALPDGVYSFSREANVTSDKAMSKNYIYSTYGIPALTFEVGDKTSLEETEAASEIFAKEMMALLLERAN